MHVNAHKKKKIILKVKHWFKKKYIYVFKGIPQNHYNFFILLNVLVNKIV